METHSPSRGDDSFGFLLVTAARLLRQRFEAALAAADLDMTPGEARTLVVADKLGPVRQTELAAALSIERRPDPDDRRSKRVHLAPKARPALRRILRVLGQAREQAMQDFGPDETAQFHDYLRRLCRSLGAAPGDGNG
ncbi:MarR family winged helix-turn-helix transcriptional regulator [Pseudoxanthomonas taiwanensis]|uniref:DNA-binding MarR family transcriptional regulator n=1 Tax=Pseudoxanthomonas taiwanensis J19 TaxID=935569 RepID=A0A562E887_9GAMM|nr:MarR family transcriptional regulator [Pseudoxanthomonas taiwanensis]TWH17818.1 DNA-binding MarR family transcriptional regulator [Pseudoxanthomonas taiwanensis J19]